MIMKNEEKLLPKCLRSIRNWVDEIIIVDTGSTDESIEIAEAYGAKVYEHPWENNFSKHRNQSISYANGDWIFILDADEELIPPSGKILKQAIGDNSIDSIAVQVINPFNNGKDCAVFNSVRVFRRNARVRYEGIVHNKEIGCERTSFYPIQILHHGYNFDEQRMKKKFDRTVSLLRNQIEQDPNNPEPHHYLSVSYMSMGPHDPGYYKKAIEESALALQLAAKRQDRAPIYLCTHYVLAASHLNLGHVDRAESVCKEALEVFPDHLDSYFLLAKIYDKIGHHKEAHQNAERYFSVREAIEKDPSQFGKIINNNFSADWLISIVLGKAEYEMGDKESANAIFKDLARSAKGNWDALALVGNFYFQKSEFREAEYYLNKASKIRKEKLHLYMLCECYAKADNADAQIRVLSDIIDLYPEEMENLKKIGMNQFHKSNFRVAGFCLSKVSEEDNLSTFSKRSLKPS
jgi:glycosyltransferase involved in cell wall biosynthesis